MKPVNLAKELGKVISTSKEYIRLLEAEKLYKLDHTAVELVKTFKKKQQVLSFNDVHSDTSLIRKELTVLFTEIENNKVIKELNDALSEFLTLKQEIYDNIEVSIKIDDEILSFNNQCGCNKDCGGCKK